MERKGREKQIEQCGKQGEEEEQEKENNKKKRRGTIFFHSKLPSLGFYPSLCSFISSFLSERSSSAVVDGHCSSPKPINSGVPMGSVLSPTLFHEFINDLSITNCPILSYADDSTLHFSISFDRRPTTQNLQDSRPGAA